MNPVLERRVTRSPAWSASTKTRIVIDLPCGTGIFRGSSSLSDSYPYAEYDQSSRTKRLCQDQLVSDQNHLSIRTTLKHLCARSQWSRPFCLVAFKWSEFLRNRYLKGLVSVFSSCMWVAERTNMGVYGGDVDDWTKRSWPNEQTSTWRRRPRRGMTWRKRETLLPV
jgi:hypothetical protein